MARRLSTTTKPVVPTMAQALRASLDVTQSIVALAELEGAGKLSSINREVSLIQLGEALDIIQVWVLQQPRAK